jgi:LCP family protein required for cell wall assembly
MAVGGVVGAVVIGTGALYARAADRVRGVERIEIAGTGAVVPGEPVSILLLGVDAAPSLGDPAAPDGSTGAASHSDSMVLVRVDPAAGTVRMTSLPRDLDVSSPGEPVERLSSVLGAGGPGAVVAQVEALGFAVDHVVLVDFDGFRDLVDLVGGVQVRIDEPLRDRMTGLQLDDAGCVRLDGQQSLALVRSRHLERFDGEAWRGDATGDLGRMDRQRAFVIALLDGARSGLAAPWTADRVAAWVQEHLTVDAELDTTTLIALVNAALGSDSWTIEDAPFPVVPATRDGAAVLRPDATAGDLTSWFGADADAGVAAPELPAVGVPIGSCE